jgi:hypothetical protein
MKLNGVSVVASFYEKTVMGLVLSVAINFVRESYRLLKPVKSVKTTKGSLEEQLLYTVVDSLIYFNAFVSNLFKGQGDRTNRSKSHF